MVASREVLAALAEASRWQEELYIHLHRNPELSMREVETAAEITRRLTSSGYEVQQIGGGVVGVLANDDGPTVLFRADIDALPVEEATDLPYASEVPGVMHACGHDFHIVAGLGAADSPRRSTRASFDFTGATDVATLGQRARSRRDGHRPWDPQIALD